MIPILPRFRAGTQRTLACTGASFGPCVCRFMGGGLKRQIKQFACNCSRTVAVRDRRSRPCSRGRWILAVVFSFLHFAAARRPGAFLAATRATAAATQRREVGIWGKQTRTLVQGARERVESRDRPVVEESDPSMKDRKKRRMGLVIGYVGTEYFGLQKSTSQDVDIRTVESVLEKALFDAGYIRESNYGDLDKIGWARCSRTDKGVHAARNVLSAKLELKLEEGKDEHAVGEEAVAEINAFLPEDLRVFSCSKVTGGFRPRDAVSYRQYEYILPVEMLRPLGTSREAPFDEEEVLRRFFEVLRQFQGTNNYHNLTKISSREIYRRLKAKAPPRVAAEVDDEQDQAEAEAEAEAGGEETNPGPTLATARVDGVRRFNTGVALNPLFEILKASALNKQQDGDIVIGDEEDGVTSALWDLQRHQGVLKMVRSNLYVCEGRVFEQGGGRFVAVSFNGQSFLYNQIRLIIGSAVGVVTGILPPEAVEIALKSPYLLYSPLAPAEGLYLRRIVFGRKKSNSVVLMPEDNELGPDGKPLHHVLMGPEAVERAQAFESEQIVGKILSAWSEELLEEWRHYATGFTIDPDTADLYRQKYAKWRETISMQEEAKAARGAARRQALLERPKEGAVNDYRRYMPQRFATDAIVHFRVRPGKDVADLQRALAYRMASGTLSLTATSEEIFDFVQQNGGAALFVSEGAALRQAVADAENAEKDGNTAAAEDKEDAAEKA